MSTRSGAEETVGVLGSFVWWIVKLSAIGAATLALALGSLAVKGGRGLFRGEGWLERRELAKGD